MNFTIEKYQRMTENGEQGSLCRAEEQVDATIIQNMKTTFIGALASFEEHFGELWGHGLCELDLSEEQMANRKVWNNARTRILNNGNRCLRAVMKSTLDSSPTLRS